jgi:Tol biopolymer transport system component
MVADGAYSLPMMLTPGVRIGPYDIQSPLGAGGMGEVYRARDTNLNRDVAVKILPEKFALDSDRMVRFQREARALAALNHPYIAAIYSLEEFRSTRALAMELVEGPTLADRLEESGPMRIEDALPIARQIAEALEYAHERGIIHRDLKPANIKVTAGGTVKLLDFGLAKTLETSSDALSGLHETLDNAPTFAVTQTGIIVGTAAYMPPEQARGETVDRRADIWAFGCVLYEMITGSRPFPGPTVSDVLAAVLRAEPDWQALPEGTPSGVRELLRRCLTKDARKRLRDIGDARIALDEMMTENEASAVQLADSAAGRKSSLVRVLPWGATAVLLLATAVLASMLYRRTADFPETAMISEILHAGRGAGGSLERITQPQVSRDGQRLVYVAPGPDRKSLLWVRSLNSTEEASPLKGTEGAYDPFWSPDGRYIAFFAGLKLMKIEVSGGPATEISDVTLGTGGAWTADNFILFGPGSISPIYRVSANGGQAKPLTSLNASRAETGHRAPQLLPDNDHFLYYVVSSSPGASGIYVGSLNGGEPALLLRVNARTFFASGNYVFFNQDGALMARPFDSHRLEISGDPVAIASLPEGYGVMDVTGSDNGILVYVSGQAQANQQLQWFNRDGTPAEIIADKSVFYTPRISPDEKEVAVAVVTSAATRDIRIYDLAQRVPRRLTFDKLHNWTPVWSPLNYKGGRKLAFSTNPKGQFHIYSKSADGTGMVEPLVEGDATEYVDSWWGDYIAYARGDQKTTPVWDIWVLPLSGDRKPLPFLQGPFNKEQPTFSPNGKWMAYAADETGTGKWEVYVTSFPKKNGNWQVSLGGGRHPRWRSDSKELFYMAPGLLMAADIQEKDDSIAVGTRHELFPTTAASPYRNYDVTADGSRFIIITTSGQPGTMGLTLIQNWQALLKKK